MKRNAKRANSHPFWLSLAYRTNIALIKLDSFYYTYHPWQATPPSTPLAHVDVYIDDFLLTAQRSRTQNTLRAALHAILTVFPDDPDSPRRAVVSASKLATGDATWSTQKEY